MSFRYSFSTTSCRDTLFHLTAAHFDGWSDLVLAQGYSLAGYWQAMGGPERMYLVPMFGIAGLKQLVGADWPAAWFAANLTLIALIVILFVAIGRRLDLDVRVVTLSSLLFLIPIDFVTWPHFWLTDTFLTFLILLAIWIATMPMRWITILMQGALLVVMSFTRPTAIPAAMAVGLFYLIIASGLERTSRHVLIAAGVGCVIAASLVYAAVMWADAAQWLPRTRAVDYLGSYAHQSVIVIHRPQAIIAMQNEFLDYVHLFYIRLLAFYTPVAEAYSNRQTLLICLVSLSLLRLYFFPSTFGKSQPRAILLISLLLVTVALFHAVTIIDYDFRYRYPMLAPLFLLVAIAAQSIFLPHSKTRKTH